MAANTFVRRGGALVRTRNIFVRRGGVLARVANGFQRRGGAWVRFYASEDQFTVTIGTDVDILTRHGYASGDPPLSGSSGMGSRSPTTIFGETITGMYWVQGASVFSFAFADATLGSSFVREIEIVGFGSDASLNYNNGSGDSIWTGDCGSALPSSGTIDVIVKR